MEKLYCPRLRHYARLNSDGSIGCCGHMTDIPKFDTYQELEKSQWLDIKELDFSFGVWPAECKRCMDSENLGTESIRTSSIKRHAILSKFDKNYLQIGGMLDNHCNSACVTCKPELSTRIGNLKGELVVKDNYEKFYSLPQNRIVEIDINGGEPSISVKYNKLLDNLPTSVKIIRINTNGAKPIKQLEKILQRGIAVIVTVSFDGTDAVHDYIRYPVKYTALQENLFYYKHLTSQYNKFKLDTWTTVSCLNVKNLKDIQDFCSQHSIRHQYAFLENPMPLNVKYKNQFTQDVDMANVGTDLDNTEELNVFLDREDLFRPGIERFWE